MGERGRAICVSRGCNSYGVPLEQKVKMVYDHIFNDIGDEHHQDKKPNKLIDS